MQNKKNVCKIIIINGKLSYKFLIDFTKYCIKGTINIENIREEPKRENQRPVTKRERERVTDIIK